MHNDRDLKPSNVLIFNSGHFKGQLLVQLTDFGLVRDRQHVQQTSHASKGLGTEAYKAPEQNRKSKVHISGKTDVFAFGLLLLFILTGRHFGNVERASEELEKTTLKDFHSFLQSAGVSERHRESKVVKRLLSLAWGCVGGEGNFAADSRFSMAEAAETLRELLDEESRGRT